MFNFYYTRSKINTENVNLSIEVAIIKKNKGGGLLNECKW